MQSHTRGIIERVSCENKGDPVDIIKGVALYKFVTGRGAIPKRKNARKRHREKFDCGDKSPSARREAFCASCALTSPVGRNKIFSLKSKTLPSENIRAPKARFRCSARFIGRSIKTVKT